MKDMGMRLRPQGPHEVTIEVPGRGDVDRILAACRGVSWIRGLNDGSVAEAPFYAPLTPRPDPVLTPHFTPSAQVRFIEPTHGQPDPSCDGVFVQHLCGYGYTTRAYAAQAEQLTAWGFQCCRSVRSGDGCYWEFWYLPGPWAAKGLAEFQDSMKIARFLLKTLSPPPGLVWLQGATWALTLS